MNYQKKLTKAQVENLNTERERISRAQSEIRDIYLRLDTKSVHDKSLYAAVEMLTIIEILLSHIVEVNRKEK